MFIVSISLCISNISFCTGYRREINCADRLVNWLARTNCLFTRTTCLLISGKDIIGDIYTTRFAGKMESRTDGRVNTKRLAGGRHCRRWNGLRGRVTWRLRGSRDTGRRRGHLQSASVVGEMKRTVSDPQATLVDSRAAVACTSGRSRSVRRLIQFTSLHTHTHTHTHTQGLQIRSLTTIQWTISSATAPVDFHAWDTQHCNSVPVATEHSRTRIDFADNRSNIACANVCRLG